MGKKSQQNGEEYELSVRDRFNARHPSTNKALMPMFGVDEKRITALSADKISIKLAGTFNIEDQDYLDIDPRGYEERHKTDVLVSASFREGNHPRNVNVGISCKSGNGNSIGRLKVHAFSELFHLNKDETIIMGLFSGANNPKYFKELLKVSPDKLLDPKGRRIFLTEVKDPRLVASILVKLKKYTNDYVEQIIRGRGDDQFKMDWMLIKKDYGEFLLPINKVIKYAKELPTIINDKGNIRVGRITVQRKGGDCGASTATDIQGKFNPEEKFIIYEGIKLS